MIVTTENIAEKDFCYGRKCTKNARKSKKLQKERRGRKKNNLIDENMK